MNSTKNWQATEKTFVRTQTGSVLLEALIAVLVFSLGILALVSMQTAALRSTSDAKYRADASLLANQIIGLMWADLPGSLVNYAHGFSATTAGASACPAAGAAATAAAAQSWLRQVSALLPGAEAGRQQITVAGNTITVRVCWLDRSVPAAAGVYHNHVVTAQIDKN